MKPVAAPASIHDSSSVELLCYARSMPTRSRIGPNDDRLNDDLAVQRYERALPAVRALARVSRVLEAASPEVSLAHYRVLSAVASGEERASIVATRLALGKPAVSAAVEALCRRGLLERLDVAADARAVALSVTRAGARVLAKVEADMTRRVLDLCARTADPDALLDCLAQLGPAMDEARNERLAARQADRR